MASTLDARRRFIDQMSDMSDIIERVALGPQEDVLAKFDDLNNRFGTDFRCTPTFRWQPGFYKKLKEVSGRLSNITVQKNKVSTYANKIQQGRWYLDTFLSKIQEIDNKLYFLRNSGICFQDNTEDVNRVLADYKNTISSTIDSAMEMYPHINISVYHGLHSNQYSNRQNRDRHAVIFHIYMEGISTNINVGSESIEVPMGNIDLIISVDLVKAIMNRIKNTRIYSHGSDQQGHSSPWNGAIFEPNERHILFPYISSHRMRWNQHLNVEFQSGQNTSSNFYNVCFGDHNRDIIESAWSGDILALFTYLDAWTKNFNVGRTGPLNAFTKMFHGIWPEMDNSEAWHATGSLEPRRRLENCEYVQILDSEQPSNPYCDRYQCTLRSECAAYQATYNLQEESNDKADMEQALRINEEGEVVNQTQLTEAQLLEMYRGINTVDIRR